jgi:hypothetical protein
VINNVILPREYGDNFAERDKRQAKPGSIVIGQILKIKKM